MVVATRASSDAIVPSPTPPSPAAPLSSVEMLAEAQRLLEARTREVLTKITCAVARVTSSDEQVARLEQDLKVTCEDLQKMMEIVVGNELRR